MKCVLQKLGGGYMHAIVLDAKNLKRLSVGGNKRVTCNINNTITLHAAILATKEGSHYIMVAKKYLTQLKIKAGSTIVVKFAIDTSPLQFYIPEEFSEVLNTDAEAEKIFNSLTPGNKRGLVALVNMVKSSDKKIERALLIAQKLKNGITAPPQIMKKV